MKPGSSEELCRSCTEVRILQHLPARCRRLSRLHSMCLVNRCSGRCSQEIDQRLSRQRLPTGCWRTGDVHQVRALQIGWQRADNIDAGDLHQLADGLYADLRFAALDNFANSRRTLAGEWRNEADLRF